MSDPGKPTSVLVKVAIVLGLLLVGWNLYTGAKIQEIGIPGIFTIKFGSNANVVQPSPPTPGKLENTLPIKYLMDNQAHRIIVVTPLEGGRYRIEEPSSPWPWEGVARIDGGQLAGEATFRNSLATMRVEGVVRGDNSIVIKYRFLTDGNGKPATGRIDEHVWYPAR